MKKILLALTISFTLFVSSAEKPKEKLADVLSKDQYNKLKEKYPQLILLAELLQASMENNITNEANAEKVCGLVQQFKDLKGSIKFDDSDPELNKMLTKLDVLLKDASDNLEKQYPQLMLLTKLQATLENVTSETNVRNAQELIGKSKELIASIRQFDDSDQELNKMLAELDAAGDAILSGLKEAKTLADQSRKDLDSEIAAVAQSAYEKSKSDKSS